METVKIHRSVYLGHKSAAAEKKTSIWDNLLTLNNKLLLNKEALLYIQLAFQCVLFIPLPILLIAYYHVPLSIVAAIFIVFVANIIACLDKLGTRSITSIFAFLFIDIFMLIMFLV